MKLSVSKNFLLLCFLIYPAASPVAAQDTLDQVLVMLKTTEISRYTYTEVREMALLQQPWQGAGVIFTAPDQVLIQQQTPKHTMVLISGDDMRYAEPERNIYLRKKLDESAMKSGPGAFLRFLSGNDTSTSLDENYATRFFTTEQGWILQLDLLDENAVESIEFKGAAGQGANQIRLDYRDGDSTVWRLKLTLQGALVASQLRQIVTIFDSAITRTGSDER